MVTGVLILILSCVLYLLGFRRRRKVLYDLSNSLPSTGAHPILGHAHLFIGGSQQIYNTMVDICNQLEETGGNGAFWIGTNMVLVVHNPDDAQLILENCLEKNYAYRFLKAWLGNGLFVAPVDLWRHHRRLLLPVFRNKQIETFVEVFGAQGAVMVDKLQERLDRGPFDAFPYITRCTLDIVFETALGERMDAQNTPDSRYVRARNTVLSRINMRMYKGWLALDWLFNLTPYARQLKEGIEVTREFADKVIKEKREAFVSNRSSSSGTRDILELLLEKGARLTDEQLREHIDSITLAGNDTTALVIAFTLVLLGQHQWAQEKVFQELIGIFGESNRLPTKEDLNEMEFLERVLKESMRLFTVVPVLGRQTQQELKLSNCTVPACVECAIVPFMLHRSEKIWGLDANIFNPDRFLPENSVGRHPCAFVPFSLGPRNCIGRHFGMLAIKSILASVIRRYKLYADAASCDQLKIEVLLFPVNGHLISIEKRSLYPQNCSEDPLNHSMTK